MSASLNDSFILGTSTVFQNRCEMQLMTACIAIQTESMNTTPFHRERDGYTAQITGSIGAFNDAVQRHSLAAATDAGVIGDATQGGTVALSSSNITTQEALVTDAHIVAAINGQFNTFFRTPGF